MPKYHITGEYGTFTVSKVVDAPNRDMAFMFTGIYETLERAGWEIDEFDDAEWDITEIDEEESNEDGND